MSGVREVIETLHVPLDPSKDFRLDIPTRFLHEESDRDRIFDIWRKDVIPTINNLCRARKSGFINRTLKREESNQYHHNRKTITYSLIFTKLSHATTGLRETRYCVAEIPENPNHAQAVEAEFVATADEAVPSSTLCSIPSAYSEIVSTLVPIEYRYDPYINPPVAAEVRAIADEDDDTQEPMVVSDRDIQRSALERMQELESIKVYLTESEYMAKRQSIMDSI
eukprot:scaffold7615_cov158-Amphora_coffeaeformis.AAC.1